MPVIEVKNLVKDYGNRRGVFDISFGIEKGEVFGFLGPNGAGKTVTIRHLLGFIKPQRGSTLINGKDTWALAHEINASVGYLPGEINFPEKMTGMELIKFMAGMRGSREIEKARWLMSLFQINPNTDIKRMSKGMKQKIAIICAFMHNGEILILDEPTNGLDPLMQETFVRLVAEEQKQGKTILMSSHTFSEVEKTCGRVAIIRQGEIAASINMADIKRPKSKVYKIKFSKDGESRRIADKSLNFEEINHEKNRVRVRIEDKDICSLLGLLSGYEIKYISEIKLTLEDYFMQFYAQREGGLQC